MHYLGIWRIFVWELGENPFGKMAEFCLETWQKLKIYVEKLAYLGKL